METFDSIAREIMMHIQYSEIHVDSRQMSTLYNDVIDSLIVFRKIEISSENHGVKSYRLFGNIPDMYRVKIRDNGATYETIQIADVTTINHNLLLNGNPRTLQSISVYTRQTGKLYKHYSRIGWFFKAVSSLPSNVFMFEFNYR